VSLNGLPTRPRSRSSAAPAPTTAPAGLPSSPTSTRRPPTSRSRCDPERRHVLPRLTETAQHGARAQHAARATGGAERATVWARWPTSTPASPTSSTSAWSSRTSTRRPVPCAARLGLRQARGVQRRVDRSDHRSRDVTVETVMARAPDGSDMFEVVRFRSPSAGAHEPAPAANRPGLRHVAFKVDDVRGVVDARPRGRLGDGRGDRRLREHFLLCYVRGPEGLIVELAERLDPRQADGRLGRELDDLYAAQRKPWARGAAPAGWPAGRPAGRPRL
jgi:catechol 2,3-dioxygenase-like lactoylglutathione lyase family enzyme